MILGKKTFGCHQLSERSFFYHGMQFPLCARCTGIFFGFVLLAPIITIFTFGNMYFSIMLIFAMGIDGLMQLYMDYESNNPKRLLTGLGFGYACFSIIVHSIDKLIYLVK